ncbi:hypothetical protein Hypma_000427 [Hypsizygus marmoreus]|uniref:Uncharacterized protein n=1 Tax=Hypsizygus marmoreus TaxID=39966 RepID=A0A369JAH5_HYPMA|nr:hypothetical protein Hypma_000427 [Hypsizygus marmoreus]
MSISIIIIPCIHPSHPHPPHQLSTSLSSTPSFLIPLFNIPVHTTNFIFTHVLILLLPPYIFRPSSILIQSSDLPLLFQQHLLDYNIQRAYDLVLKGHLQLVVFVATDIPDAHGEKHLQTNQVNPTTNT